MKETFSVLEFLNYFSIANQSLKSNQQISIFHGLRGQGEISRNLLSMVYDLDISISIVECKLFLCEFTKL